MNLSDLLVDYNQVEVPTRKITAKENEDLPISRYQRLVQYINTKEEQKTEEPEKPKESNGFTGWTYYSSNSSDNSSHNVPDVLQGISQFESGKPFGYTMSDKDLNGYDLGDANGHRTFGYGLLYHPNGKYMDQVKSTWTQSELEDLYKQTVSNMQRKVDQWSNKHNITLTKNQRDAITSACFNFGPGFLNKNIAKKIAKNPNDPSIYEDWANLSNKQGQKYPGLIKRRQKEANWYFGRS